MSIPINIHRIVDAFINADVEKRRILVENMIYNLRLMAWSTIGCACDKCKEVTSSKENELNDFWLGIINEAKTKLKS